MPEKIKPIPDEYRGATPYLCVNGGAAAIDFYKQAFGAREVMRIPMAEGKIGHAELRVGDALFMLADEFAEMNFRSPRSLGGTPVNIVIYVENVDELVKQAENAGAKVLRPPADQFYGDRMATLEDPFGHSWSFATHVEDVSPEEIEERAAAHKS
ncbi:MAG: VOC family protein [Candidatus Binatia bacterium]